MVLGMVNESGFQQAGGSDVGDGFVEEGPVGGVIDLGGRGRAVGIGDGRLDRGEVTCRPVGKITDCRRRDGIGCRLDDGGCLGDDSRSD